MSMLKTIKLLLGITAQTADQTQDAILQWLTTETEQQARAFCRIPSAEPLPDGMDGQIIHMVLSRYRVMGYGKAEPAQRFAAISDNGQSVTFKDDGVSVEDYACGGLTAAEKDRLTAYRRLW